MASFLDVFPSDRVGLEDNHIHVTMLLVDFKGGVIRDLGFLDGSFGEISVDAFFANIHVDIGSDPVRFRFSVAPLLSSLFPVPISGLRI